MSIIGRFLAALGAIAATLPLVTGDAVRAADRIRIGEGPFITGGAFYIARDKGYFQKLDLDIEIKIFMDGALSVPSMVAGELDITSVTPSAGLYNAIARGAQMVVILDRGNNKAGNAYTVTSVTQALYDEGLKSTADFGRLKGKKIGVSANGGINQYNLSQGLMKVGLDPAKDVHWIVNVPQPDLMKMLGQGQIDATELAFQFAMFAQQNKWGPMVATADKIVPGAAIGTYAVRKAFLDRNRDVVVRFAMAYLHAAKQFNAAALAPAEHSDIVEILARNTALNKPELVRAIAPNWSYVNEDGMPLVDSIMEMQDFWSGKYFNSVERKVTRDQLFDLEVAREAQARLAREQPFAK
jgi:NitT/TauT family transport system substrate-binding protein